MITTLQQLTLVALASLTCTLAEENVSCAVHESAQESDSPSLVALSHSISRSLREFPSFPAYIAKHERSYAKGSEEYEMRQKLFHHRLQQIRDHNSNTHRRWSAGVNHLSDRTEAELAQLHGLRLMKSGSLGQDAGTDDIPSLDQIEKTIIPDEKSWTDLHAIRADTNQKHCGSCWAVTTATVLRANAEIKGHDRTFSPQELVDCVPNPHHCGGTGGCKGSTVELALNWVMEQGLATLGETPYRAEDTHCKKQRAALLSHDGDDYGVNQLENMIAVGFHGSRSRHSAGLALGLRGWTRLPENEYEPLMRAVAHTGPVAVSVAAGDWHAYSDGVFDGCKHDAVIGHAVTLVGYGKSRDNDKYWTIKNSWGLQWGEGGNIRLLRHEGNVHCGTDHKPKVGTGCDGGPSAVRICGMCGILYDNVVPHFNKRI